MESQSSFEYCLMSSSVLPTPVAYAVNAPIDEAEITQILSRPIFLINWSIKATCAAPRQVPPETTKAILLISFPAIDTFDLSKDRTN